MSRARAATLPQRIALCLSLVAAAVGGTRAARADVSLCLATDGRVGAWLVAPLPGRLDDPTVADLSRPGSDARRRVGPFAVADGGTGALDVQTALPGKRGKRAVVLGTLSLAERLDGWLLLSVDGKVSAWLDGERVAERPEAHARGASWDLSPVSLATGEHTLVIALERGAPPWTLEARFVSRTDLAPPRGARWKLGGATAHDAERLAKHLAHVGLAVGLGPLGYAPRVDVDFPRGFVVDPAFPVSAVERSRGADVGAPAIALAEGGDPCSANHFEASLPAVSVADGRLPPGAPDGVVVHVGGAVRSERLALDAGAPALVARALAFLAVPPRRASAPADPGILRATVEYLVARLGAQLDARDEAAAGTSAELDAFLASIDRGGDPLTEPGVRAVARRSTIDGAPAGMVVHVPAGYVQGDPARRWPLVVVLHGYNGTPERAMQSFLGTNARTPHPRVPGLVLAPSGHGNAFYRGPGEVDVLDAIDWAMRTYSVDPDRVSVTGISMGGTGASHLGLRYPGRFSAAGALAGYHSYFVRSDIRGRRLRDWEWAELRRLSPVSFADNGRELFLYVAQGTRDKPLVHSTVLVDRYKMLGFPFTDTWPESGHDVWRIVWGDALLFPVLAAKKRPLPPRELVLRTDTLRHGTNRWLRVTSLDGGVRPGWVGARALPDHRVEISTSGVSGLELGPDVPGAEDGAPLTVDIDGARVVLPRGEPRTLERNGTTWSHAAEKAPQGALRKVPGLEGPLRDVASGPVAFVYGTLDPTETEMAREVALHFRARWSGDARSPVLADVAVPAGLERTHSLFLVGSKTSNRLVRDLDAKLPLGIDGNLVRIGASRIQGDGELGFACVFPNPSIPSRYVALVEGVSVRGLARALSLPLNLPDFIVFDSGLAPAAGQQVLGEASVLAAGYFDRSWMPPRTFPDTIRLAAGLDAAQAEAREAAEERRTRASAATAPRGSEGATRQAGALPR